MFNLSLGSFVEEISVAEWRDQLREKLEEKGEEVIPHYVKQLREHVQDDMIPVGRPLLKQVKVSLSLSFLTLSVSNDSEFF